MKVTHELTDKLAADLKVGTVFENQYGAILMKLPKCTAVVLNGGAHGQAGYILDLKDDDAVARVYMNATLVLK